MNRVVPLLLALFATPLVAQEGIPLGQGDAQSGTLASDSRDVYTVELDDSTWALGHVEQISVDVVVTILDPHGEEIAEFDGPSRGPETFTFTAKEAGTYVIAVTPFQEQQGDYEILLVKAEPVATEPAARIDQLMTPYSGDDTPSYGSTSA